MSDLERVEMAVLDVITAADLGGEPVPQFFKDFAAALKFRNEYRSEFDRQSLEEMREGVE